MNMVRSVLILLLSPLFFSASVFAQQAAPEKYIVVLHENAVPEDVASQIAQQSNGRVGYVFENVIKGFSITVPEAALQGILKNPKVSYVEEDIPVSTSAQTVPTGVKRIYANQTALDIDATDDYRVDVDVAVLDTGIDVQHPDLNVAGGANCLKTTGGPKRFRTYYCDDTESGDDDHYHGTHVAGTIGALDNGIGVVGVAPGARLWAIKVLDSQGSGSLSGIIAGIDWVAAQGDIEVINMSLGGSGTSNAMNDAIEAAFNMGVSVVVAAGNSNADSAGFTPANAPFAITVSALADFNGAAGGGAFPTCRFDQDDTLADFSNWGSIVDIAAPGVCILSTYPLERGEYSSISGTSMASPHVAGAAALLASRNYGPQAIWDTLLSSGNFNWTDDSGDGTQEPLLDISNALFDPILIPVGGPGENTPPTAAFSYSCNLLSCSFDGSSSSDSNGTIASYLWDFGDGDTGTGETTSHTYAADGTYNVRLTVTDNDGETGTTVQSVTVTGDNPAPAIVTESQNHGSTWKAVVYYSNGSLISGSYSGANSCTELAQCVSDDLRKKQGSIDFTTDTGVTVTIYKP